MTGSFDKDHPSSCSYQAYALPELLDIGSSYYDYQIELNITELRGVTFSILNGTTIYGADDIDSTDVLRNFTYNATDYNSIFFTFTPHFEEEEKPFFMAFVGLVPHEIWIEDEDDKLTTTLVVEEAETIYKHVTFSEKVLIAVTLFGLFTYCIKKKYMDKIGERGPMFYKPDDFAKWKKKKKVMDTIIEVNNPVDPWENIDDDDEGTQGGDSETDSQDADKRIEDSGKK